MLKSLDVLITAVPIWMKLRISCGKTLKLSTQAS